MVRAVEAYRSLMKAALPWNHEGWSWTVAGHRLGSGIGEVWGVPQTFWISGPRKGLDMRFEAKPDRIWVQRRLADTNWRSRWARTGRSRNLWGGPGRAVAAAAKPKKCTYEP